LRFPVNGLNHYQAWKKTVQNDEVVSRSDRLLELSHELLRYATLGLLRKDLLPKVSETLLNSSGSDAVELWVREGDTKHFRCAVSRINRMPFGFILVPCPLGEEVCEPPQGENGMGLERLCCNIINGIYDGSLAHFTYKGSFWSGDLERDLSTVPSLENGPDPMTGEFRSLALIPIEIEGVCVGLLQLKSKEKEFFKEEEVSFYEDITQLLGIALAYQYNQIELRERIKELTCLYGIAQVLAQPEVSVDELLRGIVRYLPPAWLYPEIACARIELDGKTFYTDDYVKSEFCQRSDILVKGEKVGFVEVAYREKRLTMDEGPFLAEERKLIDSIARELGNFHERTMAEEERNLLQDQLRHADRLATIGQLAAGVAHELNEPLGNILGFAQLAKKAPDVPDQTRKDLDSIESASLHAREIIKKLMVFARQTPQRKMTIDLNRVVEEGLYFFDARCAKAGITLERRLSPDIPGIVADSGQLNQVLVNLVVNGIQAMPDGGTLTVKTWVEGANLHLSVADDGAGMSTEVKKQIFLPFFTTKDVNEGTGLGLAVVHGIVTAHKGTISVDTKVGQGTKFTIQLPLSDSREEE
jgi:signal transduction histidine kinase